MLLLIIIKLVSKPEAEKPWKAARLSDAHSLARPRHRPRDPSLSVLTRPADVTRVYSILIKHITLQPIATTLHITDTSLPDPIRLLGRFTVPVVEAECLLIHSPPRHDVLGPAVHPTRVTCFSNRICLRLER